MSDRLLARLGDADLDRLRAALSPERRSRLDAVPPVPRAEMTLAYAVHEGPDDVVERLGLSRVMPPEEVHALGRGPEAAGGDYYAADLIADALEQAAAPLAGSERGLDFGCSSGRVVRVLAAAFPQSRWDGCDPIPGAIAWAREHLPGIGWEVSPLRPPLASADASYDVAFAWSVWSHFGARPARLWLDEMHRIIRPGGHLLLTSHGWHAIHEWRRRNVWDTRDLRAIADELYADGFSYREAFGPEGDGGVPQSDWGNAFMTLEWLAGSAGPGWSVRLFLPAALDDVQDITVLRREPGPSP